MSYVENARKTAEYNLGKEEMLSKIKEALHGLKNRDNMGIAFYTNVHIFEKELGIKEAGK